MAPRTIRITESCEFGGPGDRIRPEPYDVAALLVEVRRVAVYEERAGAPAPAPAPNPKRQRSEPKGKSRRASANP